MTFYKTIVCLANSRKEGGCCIAGKEIVNNQSTHNWIRPVSNSETGGLSKKAIILYSGKLPKWLSFIITLFMKRKPQPRVLDVITIPLVQHQPHAYQSENYLIDTRQRWVKQQAMLATQLSPLCDSVSSLWINGYHSSNGFNDRIPLEIVKSQINTSLLLIKPNNVYILVEREFRKVKIRAEFSFNHQQYRLAITDPKVEYTYRIKSEGEYPIQNNVYFCISLGEPFNGYCYKLVAAIIN
ncbi:MAG: hypothetical protein DRR19_29710 [Candidatus Parabeggiatoa sp. nov. 1]|nr:MAG: hypothetical protein DRR19_29710 [Gammaproteobacteria bacterium]